jgi:uncharacterized membrane protein
MRPRVRKPWLLAAMVGGIAYPFLVYVGRDHAGLSFLRPAWFILIALMLIGLRLLAMRRAGGRAGMIALSSAAAVLLSLLALDPELAVKAYPVLISLAVAGIFGSSLIWPPSIIERIARLRQPDLPPEAVAYTRTLTQIWLGFLLLNAVTAALLGLWGSLREWTLWTGLISYFLMGALFLGELVWRRFVRARA